MILVIVVLSRQLRRFFAYIDKANIGIAKINGLPEDLGIAEGTKFNIALLVFYVSYILVDMLVPCLYLAC